MGTVFGIALDIARLGDPAESEFGPIIGYVRHQGKCLGSVHQTEAGLVFIAGACTPLNSEILIAISEALDHWVN